MSLLCHWGNWGTTLSSGSSTPKPIATCHFLFPTQFPSRWEKKRKSLGGRWGVNRKLLCPRMRMRTKAPFARLLEHGTSKMEMEITTWESHIEREKPRGALPFRGGIPRSEWWVPSSPRGRLVTTTGISEHFLSPLGNNKQNHFVSVIPASAQAVQKGCVKMQVIFYARVGAALFYLFIFYR